MFRENPLKMHCVLENYGIGVKVRIVDFERQLTRFAIHFDHPIPKTTVKRALDAENRIVAEEEELGRTFHFHIRSTSPDECGKYIKNFLRILDAELKSDLEWIKRFKGHLPVSEEG
jgi:hypothetical protein